MNNPDNTYSTPRVDALMAKWDDDGATRGSAFVELRDLARELERRAATRQDSTAQAEQADFRFSQGTPVSASEAGAQQSERATAVNAAGLETVPFHLTERRAAVICEGLKMVQANPASTEESATAEHLARYLSQPQGHTPAAADAVAVPRTWYVARSVDGKQHDTGRVERVHGGFLASTYSVEEAQFIAAALNWATAYRAPAQGAAGRCAASRDGDCSRAQCPQLRDNEPRATGRHCPLDNQNEED